MTKQLIQHVGGQVARKGKQTWTQEQVDFAKQHLADKTVAEIATSLGKSEAAVRRKLRYLGLNNIKQLPRSLRDPAGVPGSVCATPWCNGVTFEVPYPSPVTPACACTR